MELTLRRQKTLFFPFKFQGPKRRLNDLQIYGHQYLEGRRPVGEGSEQTEVRGPNGGGPRGQVQCPRGTTPFGPRGSAAVDPFSTAFVLT